MSFDVSSPSDGAPCAEVVDLAARRRALAELREIPDVVLAEIDAAAERWHELRDEEREVRFGTEAETGRVTAALHDLDGAVVRVLPLRQVLSPGDDGPQSAA